ILLFAFEIDEFNRQKDALAYHRADHRGIASREEHVRRASAYRCPGKNFAIRNSRRSVGRPPAYARCPRCPCTASGRGFDSPHAAYIAVVRRVAELRTVDIIISWLEVRRDHIGIPLTNESTATRYVGTHHHVNDTQLADAEPIDSFRCTAIGAAGQYDRFREIIWPELIEVSATALSRHCRLHILLQERVARRTSARITLENRKTNIVRRLVGVRKVNAHTIERILCGEFKLHREATVILVKSNTLTG